MAFPTLSHWRTTTSRVPRTDSSLGAITLAGTLANSRGTGRPNMRVFGQWALVYLLAGEGDYSDERGTICPMRPGQWILVFPEIAHTYGPRKGANWQEVYVGFRGPAFDLWRREELFNPAQPVGYWKPPRQGVTAFREFFGLLQKSETTSLKAVCHWQNLLAQIFAPHHAAAREHPAWFEKALQLLEPSDPSSRPTLQEIAEACGLGYESFRKKFEARQGIAPGRYAMDRRIKKACRLLLMQNLTNKEIAELLGFYDEFHFSKAFGQFLGKSPRDYRRENGEHSASPNESPHDSGVPEKQQRTR